MIAASKASTSARRRARRLAAPLAGFALLCGAAATAPGGCATQPVVVNTRSLERSGRSAFVCMGDPRMAPAALPITACNAAQVPNVNDYTADFEDAGVPVAQPHLYALVTQTTRGEVAVIDTTAHNYSVLDQDPAVPGANFLPVGAQPVDIVATPGGTAAFVGVAEVGREAIFALPTGLIRPQSANGTGGAGGGGAGPTPPLPEVSSWPACRLPSAPGQMLLIPDPGVGNVPRARCDDAPGALPPAGSHGDLGAEGQGRQKLVVAMPDEGGVAVIDAQALLDRPAGSFDACPIDRWLPLDTTPPSLPVPPSPTGVACVPPEIKKPQTAQSYTSRPSGISYAQSRLYVSDLDAPLIHVVDLPTPCDPVEIEPLVPASLEDPSRVVTTTHVSVAPQLTPQLKRYLYATDALDGSAMVFDVTDDLSPRNPLPRIHPEWNPFAPIDRVRYGAPAADLLIVERDVPVPLPPTGVAPHGTRCDPDPKLTVCTTTSKTCDAGTLYRTVSTYDSGAGPLKLRGMYAFLALTNGRLGVIDIDDYDAPCRVPTKASPLLGCGPDASQVDLVNGTVLTSTGEQSCNVVLPNAPRASNYDIVQDTAGNHAAGLTAYPTLYDADGTPLNVGDTAPANMVATVPTVTAPGLQLPVAGQLITIPANGVISDNGPKNSLAMNQEDPRAQVVDQNWFVTYEGPLPGFDDKPGTLKLAVEGVTDGLFDSSARFCDNGVQSENAVAEKLAASGDPTSAASLADYLQIGVELPEQTDAFWTKDAAKEDVCGYQQCLSVFGTLDAPAVGRDFRIVEAFQDHLELKPRHNESGNDAFSKESPDPNKPGHTITQDLTQGLGPQRFTRCCFPSVINYSIRLGSQWEVAGDQSGFLHHVIADSTTGVCRDSCDPRLARMNGRLRSVASGPVKDGQPNAFINPMFRFAIVNGTKASPVQRNFQFRFTTQASFLPLFVNLSSDAQTMIQPVGMSFIQASGQLAVTDGSINGLILVDLSSSAVSKSFF